MRVPLDLPRHHPIVSGAVRRPAATILDLSFSFMAAPSVSSESRVQSFIHALEQGRLAWIIRAILGVAIVLAIALICLGWKFRGFGDPVAMDQAQVAREIARGHGWSTQFLRPLAIGQIEKNLGSLPKDGENFPDTFNAPLPPLVNAVAIKVAGTKMEVGKGEYIAPAERLIVALSMVLFLASVAVEYFLLRRLFDARLAFWAAALTLVCDLCWQYTLSGLPQMLMLLLFNGALYALLRATEVNKDIEILTGEALASTAAGGVTLEESRAAGARTSRAVFWLAVAGVLFGLLMLTHALAIWLFAGALVYVAVTFRRRGPVALVLLLAFALTYAPWIIRNYRVSGSAFGVARYALYDGLGGSTAYHMRSTSDAVFETVQLYFFRTKLQAGIVSSVENVGSGLGNFIALGFFLCLLHVFRRPEVNAMRWGVLTIWIFAVVGMALIGTGATGDPVGPNQLQVLFLPIMLGFGLAYVLVLFSRREGNAGLLPRVVLFTILSLVSALPLIFTLLPRNVPPVQTSYLQPAINVLNGWTSEHEVIASDMPWGVAWYADRKSLWLPAKFKDLLGMSDNAKLPGTLSGVFLTPISRNESFYNGIYRGEYADVEDKNPNIGYPPLIFGRRDLPLFPFQQGYSILGDLSYTFYTDRVRWAQPGAASASNTQ